MKKKIIALIMALCAALALAQVANAAEVYTTRFYSDYTLDLYVEYILTDSETGVQYIVTDNGICPRYNADGTIRTDMDEDSGFVPQIIESEDN